MNITLDAIRDDISNSVKQALVEDLGDGDITAMLIPANQTSKARIITREDCVFCGQAWLDETFSQLGGLSSINWLVRDGDSVRANATLVELEGLSRTLLTGERTAMNFMQLLSGVATKANEFATSLQNSKIRILDTRKTIPGLRTAQKYAVTVGGCHNHRIGLFDAFLIKENHIAASGGITQAIQEARKIAPDKTVEVETENLDELQEAINAKADIAMLDNFSDSMLSDAMNLDKEGTKFELSGNLSLERLQSIANMNIDYCSFGSLTKHVRAVDLSMRLET